MLDFIKKLFTKSSIPVETNHRCHPPKLEEYTKQELIDCGGGVLEEHCEICGKMMLVNYII